MNRLEYLTQLRRLLEDGGLAEDEINGNGKLMALRYAGYAARNRQAYIRPLRQRL